MDDLIEGLVRLMHTSADFTGPVNLGNKYEFTMIDLAEKIKKLAHSKSEIVFKALPIDDPKQRQPNVRLAKEVMDWNSNITLHDGLVKTIKYFNDIKHTS